MFKTHFNHRDVKSPREKNSGISKTKPDDSYTVKQILDRFASGIPFSGQKVPVYHGEEFVPDISKMDLADIQSLREQNLEKIELHKENLKRLQYEAYQKRQNEKSKSKETNKQTDSVSSEDSNKTETA